jgi:hypothetical protein
VNFGVLSQMLSFGPYNEKVMVPVGLTPPASVAVSKTAPPTATEPEAVVVTVGVTGATVTLSLGSPQSVLTGRLFWSPL